MRLNMKILLKELFSIFSFTSMLYNLWQLIYYDDFAFEVMHLYLYDMQ